MRSLSTTAPQALHLMNSEFSLQMATLTAQRICEHSNGQDQPINEAFERILGRPPSTDEHAEVTAFLAVSGNDAMAQLCLSLMNCSEFVFLD